jgi:hypothetical protein
MSVSELPAQWSRLGFMHTRQHARRAGYRLSRGEANQGGYWLAYRNQCVWLPDLKAVREAVAERRLKGMFTA